MVEYWPPVYAVFVFDIVFCSLGVVAALRTAKTSHVPGMRVAAAFLGVLYFLYLAVAGASNVLTFVKLYR